MIASTWNEQDLSVSLFLTLIQEASLNICSSDQLFVN